MYRYHLEFSYSEDNIEWFVETSSVKAHTDWEAIQLIEDQYEYVKDIRITEKSRVFQDWHNDF